MTKTSNAELDIYVKSALGKKLTPLLDCEHAEVVALLLLLRARTSSVTLIVEVESEIL